MDAVLLNAIDAGTLFINNVSDADESINAVSYKVFGFVHSELSLLLSNKSLLTKLDSPSIFNQY